MIEVTLQLQDKEDLSVWVLNSGDALNIFRVFIHEIRYRKMPGIIVINGDDWEEETHYFDDKGNVIDSVFAKRNTQ